MPSVKFFVFFQFVYLLCDLVSSINAFEPFYYYHICPNTSAYAINSTYQTSRNLLLNSLSSHANRNGFYNATAGDGPNKIYGLYLCRGDVNSSICQGCVSFATSDVTERCPLQKEAVICYDECLLRFSDEPFFSTVADDEGFMMANVDVVQFSEFVNRTMNETATEAANSPKKFMTKRKNFTASQPVYFLAQCTQDLSSFDCNRCLQLSISQLQMRREGGRQLFPSCYSRYELYQFYNKNVTAVRALPPVTTPPVYFKFTMKGGKGVPFLIIIAIIIASTAAVLSIPAGFCLVRRGRGKKKKDYTQAYIFDNEIMNSLQFDFEAIKEATNNFSTDNKLGEGGFGEVYKGILPDGRGIAVKRLSTRSCQGYEEFINEIVLVAKLHHRNLVRLLGFCSEGEEKILVYEFVPNKSLDYFLYDPEKQGELDWSSRYKMIGGIARGMCYLHEESQLKIIHRDLKASNILLDENMNPKISDFGMARIVRVDESQVNTIKIVGTYGYISPEYAVHGQCSVKSDVYSFGVLVLEIITGKKSSNFYQTDGAENLMSYAWKHWRDGTPLQLLDSSLSNSCYSRDEVIRCLHVGLLCVQEDPVERPSMATIDLMLNSYSVTVPSPQQPAFYLGSTQEVSKTEDFDSDLTANKSAPCSVDEESITEVFPR
ncbi:cysteine-rich receptor-like protein kinase 10 [Mangifera indica]|uniref:cysteine-rich receptor-like protein kinase 10 n=1 Tax=Mangifera indica TaxID=29780 RepID=UPI001CFB95CC|nr:cysteine-rich receptor-like protein kinase 10 [Mangifera indica]XP_044466896.1 cysteine-rich receptor-like protein kinase 10 [Mangifera indica]